MNCWEYKQCGREKGGVNAAAKGVCPAYPDHGRQCARVAGTLCGGKVQGEFVMKLLSCMKCDFYNSEHYDKFYGTDEAGAKDRGAEQQMLVVPLLPRMLLGAARFGGSSSARIS